MRPILGKSHVKAIGAAVDSIYNKVLDKLLGGAYSNKQLRFTVRKPPTSLPGLFQATGHVEGQKTDERLLDPLMEIAKGYLDANRERTKAQVLHTVQSFLNEAHDKGVDTDFETVLGGQLSEVFGEAKRHVKSIVQTEANTVKNTGFLDTAIKVNAMNGIDDPVLGWVCVHDQNLCQICKELHLLEDGVTPRVWKLSECTHGYYKKGDTAPPIGSIHPNDRCALFTLLPGYGFDSDGKVTWISYGHDEFAKQRKQPPQPQPEAAEHSSKQG